MTFRCLFLLVLTLLISGCIDKDEIYRNPPKEVLEQLNLYFPLSYKYVKKQQAEVLDKGLPLNSEYMKIAKRVGVKHPEKVRILYVDTLPLPENESLLFMMHRYGLVSPYFTGTTFGYGIVINKRASGDRLLISHELIHVRQAEEIGLDKQTRNYLLQIHVYGYMDSPIEVEAYENAGKYL